MRTSAEIAERICHLITTFGSSNVFLRVEQQLLASYLDNEHFERFIREGQIDPLPWTPKKLRERMPSRVDPLESSRLLAIECWSLLREHRSHSVCDAYAKMRAYFWLANEPGAVSWLSDGRLWRQLGAPILLRICELYGWPVPDDEKLQRMAAGEMCEPQCPDCEAPPNALVVT